MSQAEVAEAPTEEAPAEEAPAEEAPATEEAPPAEEGPPPPSGSTASAAKAKSTTSAKAPSQQALASQKSLAQASQKSVAQGSQKSVAQASQKSFTQASQKSIQEGSQEQVAGSAQRMSIAQDDEAAEEDDFFDAGPPPAVGSQAQAEGSLQEEEDLVDLTSNVETHQEGQYKSKNMMGTLAKAVNKFGKSRSTSNEADMVIRPKSRKPKINYENTYKTEPDSKFSSGAAKKIINAILDEHFTEDMEYATDVSRALVRRMANDIKYRCKKLGFKRYRIVSNVHMGPKLCQTLRIASRCCWDDETDTFATAYRENMRMFCCASVYAIYLE